MGLLTGADVCDDTGHDKLLLPCCFYGGAEVSVVPSVNFALTHDQWRVGVHLEDFFRKGPIGT